MNEPLTLEQLRDNKDDYPVYVKRIKPSNICDDGWCKIEFSNYDPEFAEIWWPGSEVQDYARIENYGKTWLAYAYPPAHIDREAWTAEWKRQYKSGTDAGTGYVCSKCDMWNNRPAWFCPACGRAMTEEAWEELEKRVRGKSEI